jgi:hypothetical protein
METKMKTNFKQIELLLKRLESVDGLALDLDKISLLIDRSDYLTGIIPTHYNINKLCDDIHVFINEYETLRFITTKSNDIIIDTDFTIKDILVILKSKINHLIDTLSNTFVEA